MKKYVVVYNDATVDVICQNLADAEEYILSCAEEDLYEEMLADVWDNWSESPQAFIQSYADHYALIKKTRTYPSWQYTYVYTTNGFMLDRKGVNYFIYEVEELD